MKNKIIICFLLIIVILLLLFNNNYHIEHFNIQSQVNQYIELGVPLFRVSSYIEKTANQDIVNNHIKDNNLNTREKQIRYLEQLERQLKLNEDQLIEDPDMVIDAVGVPLADYETNLKKRYERELKRLSEVDIQYEPKVLDKTWFQAQLEKDLEPPEQVEVVQESDVVAVDDIAKKNEDKVKNKTDVSQMLNLLKLKEVKGNNFNKDLNKTNLFIKKPVVSNIQKEQLAKLDQDIPNIINELKQQEQLNIQQEQNELIETELDISEEEKNNTINTVKQFIESDINNVNNLINNQFIVDNNKSLSEIEEQKKSKLFASELATKIINQDIQKDIFKIQDVVAQYFEVSGDTEFNEQVEDLF